MDTCISRQVYLSLPRQNLFFFLNFHTNSVFTHSHKQPVLVTDTFFYLRNRKHVPCFYRVIETRVEVWENKKCCGNTSRRRVFPQVFRVLSNFHKCFYNSIETRRTYACFLFLLENTKTKKNENNLLTLTIKT